MWTDKNNVNWKKRIRTFRTLLSTLEIKSVLELGCNRGYNLEALKQVGDYDMVGMDICEYPLLKSVNKDLSLVQGDIQSLPFKDNSFDLVFTVATLLYFDVEDLLVIAREINRVSKRYFLAIEYYVDPSQETMLDDRAIQCCFIPSPERWWESITAWWARDYGYFLPNLFDKRILSKEQGFGGCGWWLFDKKLVPGTGYVEL